MSYGYRAGSKRYGAFGTSTRSAVPPSGSAGTITLVPGSDGTYHYPRPPSGFNTSMDMGYGRPPAVAELRPPLGPAGAPGTMAGFTRPWQFTPPSARPYSPYAAAVYAAELIGQATLAFQPADSWNVPQGYTNYQFRPDCQRPNAAWSIPWQLHLPSGGHTCTCSSCGVAVGQMPAGTVYLDLGHRHGTISTGVGTRRFPHWYTYPAGHLGGLVRYYANIQRAYPMPSPVAVRPPFIPAGRPPVDTAFGPGRPEFARPDKPKRPKFALFGFAGPIKWLVEAAFELGDFLEVMYGCTPECGKPKPPKPTYVEMIEHVASCGGQMDVGCFVAGLVSNQLEDLLYGMFGRLTQKEAAKLGRPYGLAGAFKKIAAAVQDGSLGPSDFIDALEEAIDDVIPPMTVADLFT